MTRMMPDTSLGFVDGGRIYKISNRWTTNEKAYRCLYWVCYLPGKVRMADNIAGR